MVSVGRGATDALAEGARSLQVHQVVSCVSMPGGPILKGFSEEVAEESSSQDLGGKKVSRFLLPFSQIT